MPLAVFAGLLPSAALGYEIDPYEFNSLIGVVSFEFEKHSIKQNKSEQDSSRFRQTYSLDLKGNIFSRRLLIYDTGVRWTKNSYSTEDSNVASKNIFYYLRTTALPLSSIPLTLFASRIDSSSESGAGGLSSKTTSYGLNWFFKFRTLPALALFAQRDKNETGDSKSHTDTYRFQAKKKLGPSTNELNYYLTKSDSTIGAASTQNVLSFNNTTNISRSTQFALGTTRSNSKDEDGPRSELEGLSLSLNSKPSLEFNQHHSYTSYSTHTDGDEAKGGTYSGDMQYRFSDRLNSNLSLSINSFENNTATSRSKTEGETFGFGINYLLTKTVSLSQTASYLQVRTNTDDPSANLGDRKTFREVTTIRYNRQLDWARLGASYGLGYVEEKVDDTTGRFGGKGLDHSASLSLLEIDVNPYVGFNTQLAFSDTQSVSGNVSSVTRNYSIDAFNKRWRQYANMIGRYEKTSQESFISIYDQKKESFFFSAASTYFKNTKIDLTAEHVNNFTEISGFSRSDSESIGIGHNRQLWKGSFSLGFSYNVTNISFTGGAEEITNTLYSATYLKRFSRNIQWQAFLQRSEKTTNTNFIDTTFLQNQLFYQLRAWSLGAEHKYTITNEPGRELIDSSIIFRASRVFYRAW
ncbi:MAG: hypothetical protein Q7T24_06345 [Deltaproteobacteria bacterium]|nr:hypothetical protein [Deltaproteobacteria bacterium]